MLPIGSNVTVTCTSNTSRGGFGDSKYSMPYLIAIHFANKISEIRIKNAVVEEATGRIAKFAAMSFTMHQGAILVITPVGLKILGLAQWGLFS